MSKEITKQLSNTIDQIAIDFWSQRGAKFGEMQTIADINTKEIQCVDFPTRIKPESVFKTLKAEMEPARAGFSGDTIIKCTLWIEPIKKDGTIGQPIRLTWIDINKRYL